MWLTPDLGGHQPFFFFCLIDQDQLQFTQKVESTLPQNKEENFLAGPGCLLMKTFRKDSDKTVSGVCKWRHTGKTEVQLKNVIFCAVLPISDQSRKEDGAVDFLCLSGQTSQHILQQTALALPPWADLQLPRLVVPSSVLHMLCTSGGKMQAYVFPKTASEINYIFKLGF